MIIRRTCK